MGITTGKVIVLTGLTALALAACGGDGRGDSYPYWVTGSSAGAGGQGGEMLPSEVDVFWCEEMMPDTPDYLIQGDIDINFKGHFIPSELTIKAGEVVQFDPYNTVQNMESGVDEVKDGKFHLQQGAGGCLRFNVPGTYPFFSLGSANPMTGTIYVE